MDKSHRFQLEVDWNGNEQSGDLRLTHGVSGRIINIVWKQRQMFWHDNQETISWQPLTEYGLNDMGIVFPPWKLARVFSGDMPATMMSDDNRNWKGRWGSAEFRVRWAQDQHRVEIVDLKAGSKAVVIFND